MERQKARSQQRNDLGIAVALRTFYRQVLSVLYSSFPFGNFRPRLVRALLVCLIRKPRSAGDADLEDVNDPANCLDGVRASPRGGGSGIAMTICWRLSLGDMHASWIHMDFWRRSKKITTYGYSTPQAIPLANYERNPSLLVKV